MNDCVADSESYSVCRSSLVHILNDFWVASDALSGLPESSGARIYYDELISPEGSEHTSSEVGGVCFFSHARVEQGEQPGAGGHGAEGPGFS